MTSSTTLLHGKTAVVTGASSGLGRRFARVLHGAGATVVIGSRRQDRLEALQKELGERIIPIRCDVAEEADCIRLIEAVPGQLDILVNNAGAGNTYRAEDEPIDHWRHVLEVNLTGLFMLCQLAGRRMLQQHTGAIINVASILGLVASAPIRQASYTASKGAVVNLTRELACQWARSGVRVNALAPGWFPTEMTDPLLTDERSMAFLNANCPMGRMGESHELDGPLLFLASEASSYVTGQVLTVDGGWTAR